MEGPEDEEEVREGRGKETGEENSRKTRKETQQLKKRKRKKRCKHVKGWGGGTYRGILFNFHFLHSCKSRFASMFVIDL